MSNSINNVLDIVNTYITNYYIPYLCRYTPTQGVGHITIYINKGSSSKSKIKRRRDMIPYLILIMEIQF